MMAPNDPRFPAWVATLKAALADMDAVTRDMFRKKRNRDLGRRQHVKLYKDGYRTVKELLAQVEPEEPEGSSTH